VSGELTFSKTSNHHRLDHIFHNLWCDVIVFALLVVVAVVLRTLDNSLIVERNILKDAYNNSIRS